MSCLAPLIDAIATAVTTACRCDQAHRPVAVWAATSGGVDSTALALALAGWRDRLGALAPDCGLAHVDHGQHAASGHAGSAVQALADSLGLGFALRRPPLPLGAAEATMRDARYRALVEVATQGSFADADASGCADRFVLTAHHADDVVETVLLRLVRGPGPRGLAGMPHARTLAPTVALLRPFLAFDKTALRAAVVAADRVAIDDPTNADRRFTRNRVRAELVPALRQRAGGAAIRGLAIRGRRATARLAALEHHAEVWLDRHSVRTATWRVDLSTGDRIDHDLALEVARLLHLRLRSTPPSGPWLHRAADLLAEPRPSRLQASGALVLERTRAGMVAIDLDRTPPPPDDPIGLPADGTPTRFGATEWLVHWTGRPDGLRMRTRRSGDRLQSGRSTVALRDAMQRAAIARVDRDRLPIVVDHADRPLWFPGLTVTAEDQAGRFAVGSSTSAPGAGGGADRTARPY